MKILRITESQYKRLVRKKNLNEQRKEIIYMDPKDIRDVHSYMLNVIEFLQFITQRYHSKDLFIKKIEDGIVYLDSTKYDQDEIEHI
jgi:hypothetical protein